MTKTIPKLSPRVIDNNNPWWTKERQLQRRKLDMLYKHKKNKKYPNSTLIYNAYKTSIKRNLKSQEPIVGRL